MAEREKKKIVSKKHRARIEREQIQRRYIIIASLAIIVTVVALISIGFITEGILKPRQPIAQINDKAITTKEFASWIRFKRYLLVTEYLNTYQFVQNLGDPNSFSYFESYLLQLQSELEPGILGLSAIDELVENTLVKEEAEKLGIKVSREDVEARIDQMVFQYYPDGTPTPGPTALIPATPTLSALQMTLVPPTPTVVITETQNTEPTATPTEVAAEEPANPEPTTILPTPTVYTEKAYKDNYKNFMNYIKSYAKANEDDVFNYYENQILRERVSEAVVTDISAEEEKIWARHILFQDEATGEQSALDFLARIDAGEDFATVAEELAAPPEDPNAVINITYEDLGWFGEGMMVEPFETAARDLEVGEISVPVKTSFGWHVIQLLGRDIQPRDQANIDRLRQEEFKNWLTAKRAEAKIDITPDWISAVPLEPDIPEQAKVNPPE